ncbi:MAG TPA: single-stranded-DNA-specific exonuclease RecJ [Mesorhizobium sp.]|jgi:single-stranded-DNA-specific exonuclease|nr:single-stranded-DNA-specific exonuclease RecJ [Mesorhizobium sp.]
MLANARRCFLDVRKSATGLAWASRLDERGERAALAMAQSEGLSEVVARVLAGRGVAPGEAARFLQPTIRDLLPDPTVLTDMEAAAARLADAVVRHERVAVFGDYDVDGAASAALVARFVRHYGLEPEIYIPDRIFEGYGPNPTAMRELAKRGATLIVTVDCGTNSAEAIAAACEEGADVVVLDHHQLGGDLPPALAVVNPNRDDDLSGQGHLCAAGVVFLCLVRASRILRARLPDAGSPDLMALLDLVAIATVCDVVPLAGVNRAFVTRGLEIMRRNENLGLAALTQASRIGEPLNPYHLGFLLGPRINAGGRIGDAALGSRLLASASLDECEAIAVTLERLNRERQAIEEEMLTQARAEAEAELRQGAGPAVLVTASDQWHPGVVGLIASRLKDQARRPAFAIAFNADGVGTGSGRSVAGFDLGCLVREAVAAGLLVKGGGHAMAAGLTVARDNLGRLRAFFEEQATDAVERLRADESLAIDAALSAEGATEQLLDLLEQAGPYGSGHPAPVFALPRHRIADLRVVGSGHMQVDLRAPGGGRIKAIAFRAADTPLGDFLAAHRGSTVHAAGSLSANHWNGARSVQFKLCDAAPA